MIVLDRGKLKFLLAGRTLEVDDARPSRYRKGRTYALGTNHRRSVCRVLIVGTTVSTIKIRKAELDTPNLLARYSPHGYTDNPARAMRDEPEAVRPDEIDRVNYRRAQVAAFQDMVGSATEELAYGATRADQRRLRVIRHHAADL